MSRLAGLDALRGIAALIVAASHFNALVLGGPYIEAASLSVDFFFMLSGFIMARTYDGRMPRRFLVLRAVRLWPAMALGVVAGALLAPQLWPLLPFALLFLPTLNGMFPFNPPAWSLFCELIANAVHSLLFQRTRNVVIAIVLLAPSWAILMLDGGAPMTGWPRLPEAVLRVMIAYPIGVLLWRYNRKFNVPGWLSAACFMVVFVPQPIMQPLIILAVFPAIIWIGQSWDAGNLGVQAGRISYPLYAAHYPAFTLGLPWPLALVSASVLTVVALWLDGRRHVNVSTSHQAGTSGKPGTV